MAVEMEYGKHIPTCDNCGDTLDAEDTFDDAVQAMKDEGWTVKYVGGEVEWENLCTCCQE